jgi:hypothetical protein
MLQVSAGLRSKCETTEKEKAVIFSASFQFLSLPPLVSGFLTQIIKQDAVANSKPMGRLRGKPYDYFDVREQTHGIFRARRNRDPRDTTRRCVGF